MGAANEGASDEKAGSGAEGARAQLSAWARTALPTVASGIGISGLVSLLGAGILWVRFSAAQLPADQAVGDLPASSLLVTGVVTLVLYLVLGLLAVLVAYLLQGAVLARLAKANEGAWDKQPFLAAWVKRMKRERGVLEARSQALTDRIAALPAPPPGAAEAASGATAGSPVAGEQTDEAVHRREDLEAEQKDLARRLEQLDTSLHRGQMERARRAYAPRGTIGLAGLVAIELILVILRTEISAGFKAGTIAFVLVAAALTVYVGRDADVITQGVRAVSEVDYGLLLIAGAVLFLGISVVYTAIEASWVIVPMAVSVVLAAIVWAVGRLTPRRFFWYGIAVFASVALFGATFTYSRTLHAPSGEGAALLLKDGCVVRGIWIGEGSSRVFLGRVSVTVEGAGDNARMTIHPGSVFWVPKDQVASEAVGALVRLPGAVKQSAQLESRFHRFTELLSPGAATCKGTDPISPSELNGTGVQPAPAGGGVGASTSTQTTSGSTPPAGMTTSTSARPPGTTTSVSTQPAGTRTSTAAHSPATTTSTSARPPATSASTSTQPPGTTTSGSKTTSTRPPGRTTSGTTPGSTQPPPTTTAASPQPWQQRDRQGDWP